MCRRPLSSSSTRVTLKKNLAKRANAPNRSGSPRSLTCNHCFALKTATAGKSPIAQLAGEFAADIYSDRPVYSWKRPAIFFT
jgi:hypothetical protein